MGGAKLNVIISKFDHDDDNDIDKSELFYHLQSDKTILNESVKECKKTNDHARFVFCINVDWLD